MVDITLYQEQKAWTTVERQTKIPLAPVDEEFAGKGRYDVGGHLRNPLSGEKSDVVYYGETELIAMCEKLSYNRRWDLPPEFMEIEDDEPLAEWIACGDVSADFPELHTVTTAIIGETYRFVRVAAAETLWYLNRVTHLVDKAKKFNYPAIDLGVLTGPNKEITQAISLYFYKQVDSAGKPLYDGIFYPSRLGQNWNCLAVYASRVTPRITDMRPLHKNDPTLKQALTYMNLKLEEVSRLDVVTSGRSA